MKSKNLTNIIENLTTVLANDELPIDVDDALLVALASAVCVELRRRLPEYAVRQGDLPEDALPGARARAAACDAIAAVRAATR